MRILATIGALVLVVLAGTGIYFSGGFYSVAADVPHWRSTERVLEWFRLRAVERASRDSPSRTTRPNDAGMLRRGAASYAEMCAVCHSAPGVPESPLRQGLYPKPPDFTRGRVPARRAFWTIKHGLKMTGTPAFGGSHDEAAIWSLVDFLDRLPGLAPGDYEALVRSAPREQAMPGGHAHGGERATPHQEK